MFAHIIFSPQVDGPFLGWYQLFIVETSVDNCSCPSKTKQILGLQAIDLLAPGRASLKLFTQVSQGLWVTFIFVVSSCRKTLFPNPVLFSLWALKYYFSFVGNLYSSTIVLQEKRDTPLCFPFNRTLTDILTHIISISQERLFPFLLWFFFPLCF